LDGTDRLNLAQNGNEQRAVVNRVKKQFIIIIIIIPCNQLHTPTSGHKRIMYYTETEPCFDDKPPSSGRRQYKGTYT